MCCPPRCGSRRIRRGDFLPAWCTIPQRCARSCCCDGLTERSRAWRSDWLRFACRRNEFAGGCCEPEGGFVNTAIALVEPQMEGILHAPFNAALLHAVLLAYPETAVSFCAFPGHAR